MNKQAGFTLIELVMVIVILGVLAAVAIPSYVDLSGTATTNKNSYLDGSGYEQNNADFAKCLTTATGTVALCGSPT